jgi:hypothetical protein
MPSLALLGIDGETTSDRGTEAKVGFHGQAFARRREAPGKRFRDRIQAFRLVNLHSIISIAHLGCWRLVQTFAPVV